MKRSAIQLTIRLLSTALALVMAGTTFAQPLLNGPLVGSTVTLRNQNPAQQAETLAAMGFEGIWVDAQAGPNLQRVNAYLNAPAVTEGRIAVGSVRWAPQLRDGYQPEKVEPLYKLLAERDLPLWVRVRGNRDAQAQAIEFFRQAAAHAKTYGVELVIYPHLISPIPHAQAAYEVLQAVESDNLKLSVIWCHELKAGTHTQIADIVNEMAPHIAIVGIHGADTSFQNARRENDWSRAILPLDEGDLPPTPFINALARAGYEGPIVLKTFGINQPNAQHLPRSVQAWKNMNAGITHIAASPAIESVSISAEDRAAAAAALEAGERYEFGAFDMGSLGELPPAEQAELLVSIGYDSAIATGWHTPNVNYIEKWFNAPAVVEGRLKLPAALWTASVTAKYNQQRMDRLFTILRDNDAMLWVKGRGSSDQISLAPAFYQRLADHAAEYGVTVVLYPHHRTTYLDVEEALELMHKVDRPNVKISMHYCHELKESNDDRIPEIVGLVAEHVALVSINGADSSMNRVNSNWSKTIMPLDEGDLDPTPMVKALIEHGYTGPMFLHTYGVQGDPRNHLTRSFNRWQEIEADARGNN